jgi:hypothetical protein
MPRLPGLLGTYRSRRTPGHLYFCSVTNTKDF